jgi:hypothetical protein
MPTKIQIRRGTGETPPAGLSVGEFAYSTDVKKLFIGTGETDPYYITINNVEQLSDFLTESGGVPLSTSVDELQLLDGLTANSTELNRLDGITSTTAELNLLHNSGITNQQLQYLQNLSANVQAQLNVKASSTHTHTLGELTNVSDAAPSANSVLKWNNATLQWEPSSDEEATLATLGITVTASDLNNVNDKLSKTATGQVITQNITMGPIGSAGDDASSRQIIFHSTTAADGGADLFRSLGTNASGNLIFDGTRVLTTGAIGEDFLGFNETQTLTAGQKDTLLLNMGITATLAELNRVDGVTSPIQTQLSEKAPINSPAFTGTPTMSTNLVIGDADNRVANKKYVDDRVASIVTGSGTYSEEQEVILTNGQTYTYSLLNDFDKVFLTLYLESDNNTWTNGGNYNAQTLPSYPSIDLARVTRTETSNSEGTCIGDSQYDNNPAGCASAGYAFSFDTVTYARNPRIYIGPDGAFLARISDSVVQFTAPTPITNFSWKLKITGVNF